MKAKGIATIVSRIRARRQNRDRLEVVESRFSDIVDIYKARCKRGGGIGK